MKTLLALILILSFISCRTKKETKNIPPVGRQWNIELQNNSGTVSLILPDRLDTLFTWDQTSDCGDGCTHVDYRVQQKKFPISMESGWYWFSDLQIDSVDQFTIKHMKLNYPDNQQDSGSLKYLTFKLRSDFPNYYSNKGKIEIDTNLVISGRLFLVLGFSIFDSSRKTNYYYLNSLTSVNKNILEFYFEHRMKDRDSVGVNFIANSFKYLQTIKINGRK